MENTKVTPVKINVALLLCFPHFHLVMKRYFCVFHISKYCIRGTFVFSIFSMLGMERTFVFSIYWKHKSWNRQKSKKVLLLRFVTFVTFVFYAHPIILLTCFQFINYALSYSQLNTRNCFYEVSMWFYNGSVYSWDTGDHFTHQPLCLEVLTSISCCQCLLVLQETLFTYFSLTKLIEKPLC